MKLNQTLHNTFYFAMLFFAIITLTCCKSKNATDKKDSLTTKSKNLDEAKISTNTANSTALTALVRKLYKWHETDTMKYDGFKAVKRNPSDTLYTSIDLDENEKAIGELKETGLFADIFLNDYRKVAVRMDKELRDGSSLWPDGELSTFGNDSDSWCDCQDYPDNYWNKITLTDIKYNNGSANFKWSWGDNFYYKAKAEKVGGTWKISYLQGFDINAYSWEWWKKNKK